MSSSASGWDRCPTSSGPFTCDHAPGHGGECVTRQRGVTWVGPAQTLASVRAAQAVAVEHARQRQTMLVELRVLRARAQDALRGPDLLADASAVIPSAEAAHEAAGAPWRGRPPSDPGGDLK